jgi:hypothetical protein
MSYPGSNINNPLNGEGAFAVIGAIIMGPTGPMTQQHLGQIGSSIIGDTTGPNAVNPSGTPSGITLPTQNGFRSSRSRNK